MLDELQEYKDYLFSNDNFAKKRYRIQPRNLINSLTTIPRALEIIARKEIFGIPGDNKDERQVSDSISSPNIETEKNEPLEKTVDINIDDIPKEYHQIVKILLEWLNNFSNGEYLTWLGIKDKNKKTFQDKLSEFFKRYKKNSILLKISGCKARKNVNDLNTASWDRTIANALEWGPLKKYMLVEKEKRDKTIDLFANIYKSGQKKDAGEREMFPTNGKFSDKRIIGQRDYVLKLTAAYLSENKYDLSSVSMSIASVYNWSILNEGTNHYFKKGSEKDELFKSIIQHGQQSRLKANEAWISKFELVDITEEGSFEKWVNDPQNEGKHYYLDKGFIENLEEHICPEIPGSNMLISPIIESI